MRSVACDLGLPSASILPPQKNWPRLQPITDKDQEKISVQSARTTPPKHPKNTQNPQPSSLGVVIPIFLEPTKTILFSMGLLGSLKVYFYFRRVSLPSWERSHIPPRKTIRTQLPLKGIWIRSLEGIFRKIHLASTLFAIFPFAALGQGRPVFTV